MPHTITIDILSYPGKRHVVFLGDSEKNIYLLSPLGKTYETEVASYKSMWHIHSGGIKHLEACFEESMPPCIKIALQKWSIMCSYSTTDSSTWK